MEQQSYLEKTFKDFIELLNNNNVHYLIKNKRALGRTQDLDDIEKLEKI